MFGYNGTAECCCNEKGNCTVIKLDCPTEERTVDYIKHQFYGRFDTDNEEWNETCSKLWYTHEATIAVDTSAIEYIDDNVGVNSFHYNIHNDTDGTRRRFRPGEWVTELNEFTVGSHTIQYIHKEKFCYPWDCGLRKYPYSEEQLRELYNDVDESTLFDDDGNETEHPKIGTHFFNEIIVDGQTVWKEGTWDNIAPDCYNEATSKFFGLHENTSEEGSNEDNPYPDFKVNKYTMYLIRRDKWIYVYLKDILATKFYDDCPEDFIGLTFHLEIGGSSEHGYTRRIEISPCTFHWWKPDKWWLTKEYLTYLPMDAEEEQVSQRIDELIVSKEEKQGCPYPECCRYISNELKEYSEAITAKINGLPNYTYKDPKANTCETTANINISALNRTHKFKYSLCCGYQLQKLVEIPIGTVRRTCFSGSSDAAYYGDDLYGDTSCLVYYYNDYPLKGNIDDIKWTVFAGIIARPICLEAKYGEIINISFRDMANYAGVEISMKPSYGYAIINQFGDLEFQMPASLPFGVNTVRLEYTLYDIYGTTSRSTLTVSLKQSDIIYSGDSVVRYQPGGRINWKQLGYLYASYEGMDEYTIPRYKVSLKKNIHANIAQEDIQVNAWGNVQVNGTAGLNEGLGLTEVTVKDQFDNECKFRIISIVSKQTKPPITENIHTEIPNDIEPTPYDPPEEYNDEYRFKKGERINPEDESLIKLFPAAPYTIGYYSYLEDYYNTYYHVKLATIVASPGAKWPLRVSYSLLSLGSNVRVYIEGSDVYADFIVNGFGEKRGWISVNGARTDITIYVIDADEQGEDYYDPLPAQDYMVPYSADNEAYDFGLVNTLSFDLQLHSPHESASGYWSPENSATVPFSLYWIVQKQMIDIEDIIHAKFVHIPTISRPQYITKYSTECRDNFCWKVSDGGDGTYHKEWSVLDDEGYLIEYRKFVEDDHMLVGRNNFFYGSSISWDDLHLEDVNVQFGVGNELIDCFTHDEQPFGGNVTFTVKEEHYIQDEIETEEINPATGREILKTVEKLEGFKIYTILLDPHTHSDYRANDSEIENNASCNCPKGVQSYWYTEMDLCADPENDKYAILKTVDDCTPFNYAKDNYYNYWKYLRFSYRNGQAYIFDGYDEYGVRAAYVDEQCNVIPQDKTVWLEISVPSQDYEYPTVLRHYVTKYTIIGVSHG